MAGYTKSSQAGLTPKQKQRRENRPRGGPRSGDTRTQPVMAGTKKAADKARAKVKRTSTTTKTTAKPISTNYNVGVSKGGVSFGNAFKHFKNKGQKTFTWNGKKYSTATEKQKTTTRTNPNPRGRAGTSGQTSTGRRRSYGSVERERQNQPYIKPRNTQTLQELDPNRLTPAELKAKKEAEKRKRANRSGRTGR